MFYPYSIKVNKCSGSCDNIKDPYAKLCDPDIVKNAMKRINETRHETCKYACRLTASICNNTQRWNQEKWICESKEDLIDKRICDKEFFGLLVTACVSVINHVT